MLANVGKFWPSCQLLTWSQNALGHFCYSMNVPVAASSEFWGVDRGAQQRRAEDESKNVKVLEGLYIYNMLQARDEQSQNIFTVVILKVQVTKFHS